MAYSYKPIQTSKTVNFAAKMDARSNSEILDIDTDNTGFVFRNLQNADLFNTKALSVRPGVSNICGGIINLGFNSSKIINTVSGIGLGSSVIDYYTSINTIDNIQNVGSVTHPGFIYIPATGVTINSGTFYVRGRATSLTSNELNYDILVRCYLYELNQSGVPSLGPGFMTGVGSTAGLHSLQLTGGTVAFGTPPFPLFNDQTLPYATGSLCLGVGETRINLGTYDTTTFLTNDTAVPMVFNGPISLSGTKAYFGRITYGLTSGTTNRTIDLKCITNNSVDLSINSMLAEEFPNTNSNLRKSLDTVDKRWPVMDLSAYGSCGFLNPENVAVTNSISVPIVSGTAANGNSKTIGSNNSANLVSSTFGQTFNNLTSGTTYYGAYLWATPQNPSNNYVMHNADGTLTSGLKTIGIATDLSFVPAPSGNIGSGNYKITNKTSVASSSGSYTFDFGSINDGAGLANNSNLNFRLDKIYTPFDLPVTIAQTGTYLLNYKFYDMATKSSLIGYDQSITGVTTYLSPLGVGVNNYNNYSGAFVYDYSGINTFQQIPTGIFANSAEYVLDCGLITVPSGNGITSIYDYRVGSNRVQKIITTIRDVVQSSIFGNCNFTTLFSGAVIGNNNKWSHATYQNLLFSHQYSKISGVCWDQIYLNPSGYNSMQLHGQRPAFTATVVSGISGIYSGVSYGINGNYSIDILLATQMGTGGIRASNVQTVTLSGSNNYIRISGPSGVTNPWFGNSILNPSGFPIESQYAFDVLPQATYVFCTQPSGNIFYLADVMNYPNPIQTGFSLLNNPLPNKNTFNISGVPNLSSNPTASGVKGNLTGLYIGDVSSVSLTQQIPNIINYDQNYLNEQVDTPMFKKLVVFKDYLLGVGDPNNPSALWYSQQFSPQIYGEDGVFCGNVQIDADNGSPITGIGVFKDYLLIFKYNSTYRLTYTGDPSTPFSVFQLSSTIGNLGFFNPVITDYGVFGLSQFGPFLATYAGIDTCGDEILPFFQTLDEAHLTFSTAIHDRARQQIYWSISDDYNSSPNNIGLTYSYVEKAWSIRQNGLWNAAGIIGDNDNFNLLYAGDAIGQLQQISNTSANTDTVFATTEGLSVQVPITLTSTTPWLSMGDSQHLKQLRSLRFNCTTAAEAIKIDVYFDQDDNTVQYSRVLDMNAPVINRSVSLAGTCRTVKFVFTTVNGSVPVRINSMQMAYQDLGLRSNI